MSRKRVIAIGVHLTKLTKDDYLRTLEGTDLGERLTNLMPDPQGGYTVIDDEGGMWRVIIQDGQLDVRAYSSERANYV
jgi:hypothetical protein